MPVSSGSRQILLRITRRSDGKAIFMNIAEHDNQSVKFIKTHLRQKFHPHETFRLYYNGRHIKSRHLLSYYGLTSDQGQIELILVE